jgi:16S rRNA (guanine(966)-N(2))-methyltransferase RsmD
VLTAGNPQALEGSVWLDLFAGTGAVGIEALSRGASMVYFVESSKRAAELVKLNLETLGISAGFEIVQKEALRGIADLERKQVSPNFIFLDPPYRLQKAYADTLDWLGKSEVGRTACVVVEHEKKFDPGTELGSLRRVRKLDQGDATLSLYQRAL